MSRRKSNAVRSKDQNNNTFYMKESKTIDFNQVQPKLNKVKKHLDLVPKSVNQEKYILSLLNDSTDVVVVSGPAGTGKTYLAMIAAIKAYREGKCNNIILTRPAVSVDDEKHGFLPGDLTAKMEPWTRPLMDVLKEFYSVKELTYMLEEQIIEIAPLAFMRGRTFKNCWIILDEGQNSTPAQLKMLLTRIGQNSKIIITGDTDQTDRKTADNGLLDLYHKLKKHPVQGIDSCEFTVKDVQRHHIIEKVLKLYSS